MSAVNSTFITPFQAPPTTTCETHIINRGYPTKYEADSHSMQLDAKLEIHQKYKYKLSKTHQLRGAAALRRLYRSTCTRCSTRGGNWSAKLNHFFNAKTYTSESTSYCRQFLHLLLHEKFAWCIHYIFRLASDYTLIRKLPIFACAAARASFRPLLPPPASVLATAGRVK